MVRIIAAERRDAQRALRRVVVDGKVLVRQEQSERVPLAEGVVDGLADWALRRVPRLLRVEPRLEVVHQGAALRLPHLEVLVRAEEIGVEGSALDPVDIEDEANRALRCVRRGGLRVEELAAKVGEAAGALPSARDGHAVVAGVPVHHELPERVSEHADRRLA